MRDMYQCARRFVAQRRKAIVGVVVGVVAAQAVRRGVELSEAQADWLTMVLTGVSVWAFPNETGDQ